MAKDYKKLTELHGWDKNPRSIKGKDFDRLKKQIQKLGQYKPLLITKDNEVIGGNMRLKAYKELGINEVWVSVVDPKDDNEKLEYALSDNDRAGFYDSDLLANLVSGTREMVVWGQCTNSVMRWYGFMPIHQSQQKQWERQNQEKEL